MMDRLKSYRAAMSTIGNEPRQQTGRWLNNRAENSHQPFRRRERAMASKSSANQNLEIKTHLQASPQRTAPHGVDDASSRCKTCRGVFLIGSVLDEKLRKIAFIR